MSFMNGLSAAGAGASKFIGDVAEADQKADLQKQAMVLADQLATNREVNVTQPFQASESTKAQTAEAARSDANNRTSLGIAGIQTGSAQKIAQMQIDAPTPEIKSAQLFAKLSPVEKQAYREEMMTKAGLPAWMIGGGDTPSPPTGAAPAVFDSAGTADAGAKTEPVDGAAPTQPTTDTGRNEKALQGVPGAAASIVKGMVDGRITPPSSFAMSKPYWQGLISKAAEYDPTFDQTTWAGRVATRKSFAAGQDATAVTALNTALGHASRLSDQFDKLNNSGGILTPLNAPINYLEKQFGDSRQTNVQQTVDALASEARKVFAASGGGNLTELQEWQKNFPVNGSPSQQKGALTNFVELLDSRLQSLAEKYNRGMGRTDDPMTLLQPNARAAYVKLTGSQPENAVGHQMGTPNTTAQPATKPETPATPDLPALPPGISAPPKGFRIIQ